MSRLIDHTHPRPMPDVELDRIRAYFITGRLKPIGYACNNHAVASIIARLEITEQNVTTLQKALDDVRRQLERTQKEL